MELIHRHDITLWDTVPQLADLLADELEGSHQGSGALRLYLLSGDKIPLALPERLHALNADATLMSLGGATEGSIWSMLPEMQRCLAINMA